MGPLHKLQVAGVIFTEEIPLKIHIFLFVIVYVYRNLLDSSLLLFKF